MRYIRAARRVPGKMNKTEAAYAQELELEKRAGAILDYSFESMTLKLGDDCRYTPDFVVILPNMELEMREVKGFWRDDAKVKIRVAADNFPFHFVAITKEGGAWKREEF